ncbi:MAG: hypothetical protein ACRBB3_10420 [Alphaproteobacteria bacterium]
MGLSRKFSEKLEHEMFLPISRLGLENFAQKAYEEFTKSSGLQRSHITRNAFLLNFANSLETHGTSIAPDILQRSMERMNLRTAIILHGHAEEFLKSQGKDGKISNDLTAASIAAPILEYDVDNDKYIGLIGSKAFNLAYISNEINNDPELMDKDHIPAEAKALHLSLVIRTMNSSMTITDHEIDKDQTLSPVTHAAISEALDHIDLLTLDKDNSSLEDLLLRKASILQYILDKTPVCNRENVIDISGNLSSNDR